MRSGVHLIDEDVGEMCSRNTHVAVVICVPLHVCDDSDSCGIWTENQDEFCNRGHDGHLGCTFSIQHKGLGVGSNQVDSVRAL